MKRNLYILIWIGIIIGLLGCANDETQDTTDESSEKTVEDDMGHEVTIPDSPERIIAPYLEDELLTLDMKPIVQWSVHDGSSIQAYLQEELDDVPTIPHDLPFEVVTGYNPDLIVLNSASLAESGKYENYSKIAPTFVVDSDSYDNWRERLKRVAELFGKEKEAEKKLSQYGQLIGDTKSQLHKHIGGESVAAIWVFQDEFFMVHQGKSSGQVLYQDLGLAVPEVVKDISESGEGDWLPVSLERLAELKADHLFIITDQIGDGKEAIQEEVFSNIPAVKKGNLYEYTREDSWLYSGYLANTQIIQDVSESLVE